MAVFGWFGTSALLAGLFRLGWGDHSFRAFLKDKYVPAALRFDDPGSYVLFLLVISFAVLMGMALEIPRYVCLLYTSPSPRDGLLSRMPSSA